MPVSVMAENPNSAWSTGYSGLGALDAASNAAVVIATSQKAAARGKARRVVVTGLGCDVASRVVIAGSVSAYRSSCIERFGTRSSRALVPRKSNVMTTTSRVLIHPDLADVELTAVLFALSDTSRLELVRRIAAEGTLTVAQCVDPDVAKSTFSHHLKDAARAGLIRNELPAVSARSRSDETRSSALPRAAWNSVL